MMTMTLFSNSLPLSLLFFINRKRVRILRHYRHQRHSDWRAGFRNSRNPSILNLEDPFGAVEWAQAVGQMGRRFAGQQHCSQV
jgi:hypothetical protein